MKEPERARAIFRYGLDTLPRSGVGELYKRFVAFEKQQGSREGIEVRCESRGGPQAVF